MINGRTVSWALLAASFGLFGLLGLLWMPWADSAAADERLKGIACRSVHLQYRADEATVFYNELKVEKSAPGTYFCVCGFSKGYYGIQELGNGKKLLIFSVWDPGKQNDPNTVEADRRVKLLHQGEGVRVGRFGNEGTGGQSFYDFDWKLGEMYRFMVTAKKNGKRTEYAGYFFHPKEKKWKHLVTFSTLAKGHLLRGYYSFVEDFRRNRISAKQPRRARFGNGWVRTASGEWIALTRAKFTADRNPVTNIDAGVVDKSFYLETGGETENTGTPLWKTMTLAPVKLPEGV